MKKNIKRLLAALVVVVLALALCACGSTGAGSDDTGVATDGTVSGSSDYTIGVVVKTASNAHFQDLAYGAMLAAEDYGVELITLNTATEADVEGQIQMVEDLISRGCDAIILTANDSAGVSSAVEACHDAGVVFQCTDTVIDNAWGDNYDEYVPSFIGVDHQQAGYTVAKAVCEKIGGSGNVVILRGMDAASSSNDRTAGFKQAIAEYPGITVVAEQSGEYDMQTAQEKMADILQANKDVDAVLCCNDLMGVGVINALEEQGYTVGGDDGVVVCGIDGNLVGLESIDEGKMYCTLYDWTVLQGYWSVYNCVQSLGGNAVAEDITAPSTVITADNVGKFLPHANALAEWSMGDPINK